MLAIRLQRLGRKGYPVYRLLSRNHNATHQVAVWSPMLAATIRTPSKLLFR